jgi:Ser/Thr protein kinase RdoA (MazF antagonist)
MLSLERVIEEEYDVPVDSMYEILFGFSNKNFGIVSGNNKYVCRLSPQSKAGHIDMELGVLSRLSSSIEGFKVPKNIKTVNGGEYLIKGDTVITLFDHIEGENASLYRDKLESFQEDFAKKVARLHTSLSDVRTFPLIYTHENAVFSYADIFNEYYSSTNPNSWQRAMMRKEPNIISETESYVSYFRKLGDTKLVHTDLRLENLLLNNNKVVGIVDFDDILLGSQAYDLSKIMIDVFGRRCSNSSDIEQIIDIDGFEKFVTTYCDTMKSNSPDFMRQIVDLSKLTAIHVLSLTGRDPDFSTKERFKTIKTYSSILRALSRDENLSKILSTLEKIQRN